MLKCFLNKKFFCFVMFCSISKAGAYENNSLGGLRGLVGFSGQVLIPSCSIATEDLYQEVSFGYIPIRDLVSGNQSHTKEIKIILNNCNLQGVGNSNYDLSKFKIEFSGKEGSKKGRFALTGDAKGIELEVSKSLASLHNIEKDVSYKLDGAGTPFFYEVRIVKNAEKFEKGYFFASLNFEINYQ
ncbi:Type 1 fimbrial protein [Vibrio jasicida]|uniref:fimbrial protein n=1 Tax=Vibrio jasicida TaxID=766224 RepID=UPI0028948E13|nr:Type 1 fimbrial protein [Vibrio jasicida]